MDILQTNGCLSSASWWLLLFGKITELEAVWPTKGCFDWEEEFVEVVRPVDSEGCDFRQPKILQIVCPKLVENRQ